MRWLVRIRGGHRDPDVEREAQLDLRDGLLEARADRIAELEVENARLKNELAKALLIQWLPQLLRNPFTDRRNP